MGKFGVKGDKERFKAAAKDKKKETGRGDGSTSKRKEAEVEPSQKSKQLKKARTDTGPSKVEPKKKKPSGAAVVVGLPAENVRTAEQLLETAPEQLRLKEFLSEISKAFSRASFDESSSSDSNRAKFLLSFNRIITVCGLNYIISNTTLMKFSLFFHLNAQGLYAQFETVLALDSADKPWKEKVGDLERLLKEAEEKFERVKEALEKTKASNSELRTMLTQSEDARQELSAELEEDRERFELEARKFRDQIIELQGLVARQCEEIEQLKVGEGLDLEAFIDSDAFESIKDSIEDATGDELIRRINEAYPDLDLFFLTMDKPDSSPADKPDSPPASNAELGNEEEQVEPKDVEPNSVDEGGAA